MKINTLLRKIGFLEKTYNETIVLVNKDIMMPLGIYVDNGVFYARVYKGSKLYNYLSRPRMNNELVEAYLCIPSTPLLFYIVIFEKNKVIPIEKRGLICFKDCSACIKCNIQKIRVERESYVIKLTPIKVVVLKKMPRVYHRFEHAIVEALVYYTKIPYVSRRKALEYLKKILWCREIVYHSTYSRKYRRIINNIVNRSIDVYNSVFNNKKSKIMGK